MTSENKKKPVVRKPVLRMIPRNQISGVNWILDVVDDLAAFCRYRGLDASAAALADARGAIAAELEIRVANDDPELVESVDDRSD